MNKNSSTKLPRAFIIGILVLFFYGIYQLLTVIYVNRTSYFSPYYTEEVYKSLESAFDSSQYRIKENPGIIPDETVYSYAAGAYLHGRDPILINSERTPLGKYIIALFILFFKNDKFVVIPFGLLTLVSIWLLAVQVFKNKIIALLPVTFFCFERLFLDQFIYTPLLDIIHLPFILLTLYFFLQEHKKGSYWITSIMLGFTIATKTVYSGMLLTVVFLTYLLLQKKFDNVLHFILYLPLSFIILLLSYTQTFLHGYTFIDFIGFQKWILLYDKSKLLYPFSIWRLVFLNQWQTWWGDFRLLKADDWNIAWPIFTILTLVLIFLVLVKKIRVTPAISVLCLWFLYYSVYLSLGIASSRFLLPILPIMYMLGFRLVIEYLSKFFLRKSAARIH